MLTYQGDGWLCPYGNVYQVGHLVLAVDRCVVWRWLQIRLKVPSIAPHLSGWYIHMVRVRSVCLANYCTKYLAILHVHPYRKVIIKLR